MLATAVAWVAACQPVAPPVRTPDEPRGSNNARRADAAPLAQLVVDAAREAPDAAAAVRPRAPRAPFRIERVAALDAARMFAVSDDKLYRVSEGQWQQLAIDGGVARDVVAMRGALWVLVQGRGDNESSALILRSTDGDALVPAWVVRDPRGGDASGWSVRALALRGGSWVIAGQHPALVRVESGGARVEFDGEGASYTRAYGLQDDSIVCTREDGDIDVVRYGVRTTVVSDGLLQGIYDRESFGYVVHEDGAVWRGRPAKEMRRLVSAAPFEPRVAAILGDGHAALVGAGGPLAISRGAGWQVRPGDWPSRPVALLATEPPLVVGEDGVVVQVEGAGRRVVRAFDVAPNAENE